MHTLEVVRRLCAALCYRQHDVIARTPPNDDDLRVLNDVLTVVPMQAPLVVAVLGVA